MSSGSGALPRDRLSERCHRLWRWELVGREAECGSKPRGDLGVGGDGLAEWPAADGATSATTGSIT